MFKLFKKDNEKYNYFKTFIEISLKIVEVNDLLSINIERDSLNSLEEILSQIQIIDISMNNQKKELLIYLFEDFLPPIERKDILDLTYSLDAVLKNSMDLITYLEMYQIKTVTPMMDQLIEVTVKVTRELPQLMEALEDFKHPKKIRERLTKINEVNSQGGKLYQRAVKDLYSNEMSTIDVMKYSEIYDHLNEVLRSIERLGNIVEGVIILNT